MLLTMKRCWLRSGGWGIGPVGRKGNVPGMTAEGGGEGRGKEGRGRFSKVSRRSSIANTGQTSCLPCSPINCWYWNSTAGGGKGWWDGAVVP